MVARISIPTIRKAYITETVAALMIDDTDTAANKLWSSELILLATTQLSDRISANGALIDNHIADRIAHIESYTRSQLTGFGPLATLTNGQRVNIVGEPHLFRYDSGFDTNSADGGTALPVTIDGSSAGAMLREFEGPIHLDWFGAVADYDGTSGTNIRSILINAIASCVSQGKELYLDGDYFTTGFAIDLSGLPGVVGPGSINGTNNSFRARSVPDGTVVTEVDYHTNLPRFKGFIKSINTATSPAEFGWILNGPEKPKTNTEAAELRIPFGDLSGLNAASTGSWFSLRVAASRGVTTIAHRGHTLVNVLVFVSRRASAGGPANNFITTKTTFKDQPVPSNQDQDISVEAFLDGFELVFWIRPLNLSNHNYSVEMNVVGQDSSSYVRSIADANWTLVTGLPAITESANVYNPGVAASSDPNPAGQNPYTATTRALDSSSKEFDKYELSNSDIDVVLAGVAKHTARVTGSLGFSVNFILSDTTLVKAVSAGQTVTFAQKVNGGYEYF